MMTYIAHVAVIAFAVVLAALRFGLESHPVSAAGTYEAIAHLFVGGLIGLSVTRCKGWPVLAGVAVAISLVEIAAAVIGRM